MIEEFELPDHVVPDAVYRALDEGFAEYVPEDWYFPIQDQRVRLTDAGRLEIKRLRRLLKEEGVDV